MYKRFIWLIILSIVLLVFAVGGLVAAPKKKTSGGPSATKTTDPIDAMLPKAPPAGAEQTISGSVQMYQKSVNGYNVEVPMLITAQGAIFIGAADNAEGKAQKEILKQAAQDKKDVTITGLFALQDGRGYVQVRKVEVK